MPGPGWKKTALHEGWWTGDNVELAVGQGYLLVTPLQVARMLAAVAAGGVLRQPYVVASTTQSDGTVVHQFGPIVSGHVPVSAANLAVIQRAMTGVTTEPFGTAIATFRNYQYAVAGKTGTAEAPGGGNPEAWFAADLPHQAAASRAGRARGEWGRGCSHGRAYRPRCHQRLLQIHR